MIWVVFLSAAAVGVLFSFVVVRALSAGNLHGPIFVSNVGTFVSLIPFIPIFIAFDIPDEPVLLIFVVAGGIFSWLYYFWRRSDG